MKSRQFIWLLLFLTALNLNSYANSVKSIESSTPKKVFVLIRSEQNQIELEKFKQQINDDLELQNVSVVIKFYRRSRPLPQTKIFKTAYSGNYDVLLLIEQIAKYSLDNRVTNSVVKMGGKYKIQTYNLKERTYTWVDHGNSNCNISVDMSLKAFSNKVLSSINIEPKLNSPVKESRLAHSNNNSIKDITLYNDLLYQLEKQKKKTNAILFKIKELKIKLGINVVSDQNLAQLDSN